MFFRFKKVFLLTALLAFVAVIAFAGGCSLDALNANNDTSGARNQASAEPALPGVKPGTIAEIVKHTGPAVVKVSVEKEAANRYSHPFANDPFFRYFFGDNNEQPRMETGLGSGFIISPDGYILTNEHVVSGADKITVTVQEGEKQYQARQVGGDYDLDLAVLKIEAGNDLPFLKLGDSEKIEVGNWVVAIGNPFGFDHTVTVGVISAKGRPVPVEGRYYKNLLQTDAAINPGNSGGPLLNLAGEVVGINTAVAQAQGIGFAIPTSTVKEVLDELMDKGKVIRPWLGIQMHNITPDLADYFGLKSTDGIIVMGVLEGSPADRAGLRQGDIILQMDEQPVANPEELANRIKEAEIGQKILLMVYRNGTPAYITVKVGEKP